MKPRINIWRNALGELKWQCTGIHQHIQHETYALGDTPSSAYWAWLDDGDIQF